MERENCCAFRKEEDGDIFTWKNYDINSIILLSNSYHNLPDEGTMNRPSLRGLE